jgi:6,7-dimethyl-8-ribityllumazine synthase
VSSERFGPQAHIGYVQASWHSDILDGGYQAFVAEMEALGISADRIDHFQVAGALEIPLHIKMLAKTGRYGALLGAGWIVDAGVYRHEFVASTVVNALMQIQLEAEIPVFSLVLTPHHFHSHADHTTFFTDHFVLKGQEAARACVRTMDSLAKIAALPAPAEA